MKGQKGCNESAASYAWMVRALGLDGGTDDLVSRKWSECRRDMLGMSQQFVNLANWAADFWLCQGSSVHEGILTPRWLPPSQISDWPVFNDERPPEPSAQASRHDAFQSALAQSDSADDDNASAVQAFSALRGRICAHADIHMLKLEHIRAWLGASVGHLLMSVMLTPPEQQQEQLVQVTIDRLALPRRVNSDSPEPNQFQERHLETLYNSRLSPEGDLSQSVLRSGQGEEWREHWNWLAQDIEAQDALSAVRTAACLMRSNALLVGLLLAMQQPEPYWWRMSLAVIRRWLLTLQAMTWLEVALQQTWIEVRPKDLACFAMAALKPGWPRHEMAISHRSGDVKPTLIDMSVWQAPWCAIDANFVPAWENNTAMVWGLFAATPDIVRIVSPTYTDSLWCRRELELTDYLVEQADFLRGRRVMTIAGAATRSLDTHVDARVRQATAGERADFALLSGFPPLTTVWRVPELADWEAKLLRAGGALRVLNAFAGDPETANAIAAGLASGQPLPPPAPTNNRDGWQLYASVFRDLWRLFPTQDKLLPIRLPAGYGGTAVATDRDLWMRIPDLSQGSFDGADIFAAIEWCKTEFAALREENRGDRTVVNCQAVTAQAWRDDSGHSLARGLLSMRWQYPVWILQRAGQTVEHWPFVGERPIFTEHVASQYAWMMEVFLPRPDARAVYIEHCELELAASVVNRLRGVAQDYS